MIDELADETDRAREDAVFRHGVRERDPVAWKQLIALYKPVLRRQASRLLPEHLDPENAVAEVWFRAFLNARRYDPERSPLPWLARICANFCFNTRRGPRARPPQELSANLAAPAALQAPDPDVRRTAFRDALASLPDRDREIVTLRYLFEVPVQEIAALLGLTPNTVSHLLVDALKRLRTNPAMVVLAEWTGIGNLEGMEGFTP
jgi:RNA polymerase sigma factor (sigma-70 family)